MLMHVLSRGILAASQKLAKMEVDIENLKKDMRRVKAVVIDRSKLGPEPQAPPFPGVMARRWAAPADEVA